MSSARSIKGMVVGIAMTFSLVGCQGKSFSMPSMPTMPKFGWFGSDKTAKGDWAEHVGAGRLRVWGAGLYDRGPQVYKELQQKPTLSAFLECVGMPDSLEVLPSKKRGDPPEVLLRFNRKGTVEISWFDEGYYVGAPLEPFEKKAQERKRIPPPPPPPDPSNPPLVDNATASDRELCPIESWEDRCIELCKENSTYEWCEH